MEMGMWDPPPTAILSAPSVTQLRSTLFNLIDDAEHEEDEPVTVRDAYWSRWDPLWADGPGCESLCGTCHGVSSRPPYISRFIG
jgi:hypothetical protein